MIDHLVLVVLAVIGTSCNGASKERMWQKCDRKDGNFNECLKKSVADAFLKAPIKELGLVTFDPLELPSLVIGAGTGPVAFEQNFRNMRVIGVSKMAVTKAEMDFNTNTLRVVAQGTFRLEFHYKINGKLLVFPISGDGPGSFDMVNTNLDIKFNLEEYKKEGKTYYRIKSSALSITPTKIVYVLENLFNGDKTLGDNINRVLNDNWAPVFEDVKASYEDVFGQIYSSIFSNVLAKVTKAELFGDA